MGSYERARSFSEAPAHQYWAEHPNMPGRPKGLHGTTVANSEHEALKNLHNEVQSGEASGQRRVPDGEHHVTVMRFTPGQGAPVAHLIVRHTVENGVTVPSKGGVFTPDLKNAIDWSK
jgi:hypothetical protein